MSSSTAREADDCGFPIPINSSAGRAPILTHELFPSTEAKDDHLQGWTSCLDHLEKLSENAASAIRNIKFDKVVVWDGGSGNGNGATAGFLQGLARSLPPMLNIMRDVGGIEMPEVLGKILGEEKKADSNGSDAAGGEENAPPHRPRPTPAS